jgi:hypothetical protein
MAAGGEPEPILEPESIRGRADERSAGSEDPSRLLDQRPRRADVLEQLPRHDHVEAVVREGERLVEVGPLGLQAELLGDGERLPVDVDTDDLVAVEVRPRKRSIAAAQVEHAPTRPADVAAEQGSSFGRRIDEPAAALLAVVVGILRALLFELRHERESRAWVNSTFVSTTADPEAPPEQETPAVAVDIRASRAALLARPPLRALLRRVASIAALLTIDLIGLALGLYVALVLRWLYYEHELPLWGVPWEAEEQWLPFLTLITILVFWQAGLYAERERRAGVGRIVSSIALVAVLTLVFGWGVDYHFGTYGLAPTAVVICAALIALLRASYDRITGDLLRMSGVRRRATPSASTGSDPTS